MVSVEKISNNKIQYNKDIKRNNYSTSSINNIFPDNADKSSDKPKSVLDVKTEQDVADLTGIDKSLLDKIIEFEGFKLEKYKDGKAYSIGIGHNITKDTNYTYGNKITEEQVYKLFAKDLIKVKNDIKECIGDTELSKEQNEALIELFFNVGIENIQGKNLINLIKNKKFDDASAEFNFVCTGGVANPSLCIRRMFDIEKFSTGNHSPQSVNEMKKIMEKGENFFKNPKKANNLTDKNYYIDETKKLLNQAQEEFEEEQKEQEKSVRKKTTPIFEPIPTQKPQFVLKLK